MKLTHQKLSTTIHGLAYFLLIINLLLMNLNVLTGEPTFIWINIALGLLIIFLCIVVLFMRKGKDSTPLFGVLISFYAIIVSMGIL